MGSNSTDGFKLYTFPDYLSFHNSTISWYDQTADKIDKKAMSQGVKDSEHLIVFLSSNQDGTGTLGRPFCQVGASQLFVPPAVGLTSPSTV